MKYILISIISLFILTGCSGKKYFEPENTKSDLKVVESDMPEIISSMNRAGATLEDGSFITKDGVSKIKLPEGFQFLNMTEDGKVIATNYKDKLLIGDKEIPFKEPVIGATLKNDKLALIYSNNTLELIDLAKNKTLFKEYLELSLANDTRTANPYFMGNLILFPTLNGKVVIISALTNESVKNIAVDPDGKFNNIIFLHVIESSQTLIVATPNKVVSISPKEILAKSYELRDITVNGEDIYIATIDGQIMKLTTTLNEVAKKKYKYAKIHALAYSNSLYAVESQGYIINISEDFINDAVYKFGFDNEKRMIAIGDKIFFDSSYITLP